MSINIVKEYNYRGNGLDLLELFHDESYLFFLNSSLYDVHRGRYSFLGFDPFDIFTHKGPGALSLLKKKSAAYFNEKKFSSSPLNSGLVGFLGYECGLHQENIAVRSQDDLNLPDCFFGFYDCILTVDHFTQKLYVCSTGLAENNSLLREKRAKQRAEYIDKKFCALSEGAMNERGGFDEQDASFLEATSNFSKQQYLSAVEKALDYIKQGEIYQVNLAQRFSFDFPTDSQTSLEIYRSLKKLSPSHFGGYLDCGDFQIISSSPERFLKLRDHVVQMRPMKGTRARGRTPIEDKQFKEDLERSTKDKAELLMITDLERNDLGKVCQYGSIQVKEMRTIEQYASVFQTTSTIEGVLHKDKDSFDLLRACFPSGSITGCPKIRSMEIIEELEPTCRGPYTGALGYLSFTGEMDFNILIRTILAVPSRIHFQVGAGIVADSVPEKEYEETLLKAKAMQDCLAQIFSQKTARNS